MFGIADISQLGEDKVVPHPPEDVSWEWQRRDPAVPRRIAVTKVLGDRGVLPASVPPFIFEGQPMLLLTNPVVCKLGGFKCGTYC